MSTSLFRSPSAVIPMAMSSVALITVIFHLLAIGAGPATGEGTSAHLFQLLIAGQAPFVAFFALAPVVLFDL